MDSANRRKIFNIFVYSVFVLLVSFFLIYNYLGDRFAARDANADNSEGRFVYNGQDLQFQPFGENLGRPRYQATSRGAAYSTSGYKSLNRISFNVSNVPLGSAVQLCITRIDRDSGVEVDVICDGRNLEVGSSAVWEFSPEFGILIEPNADYYCKAVIDVTRQDIQQTDRYEAARSGCELEVESINTRDNLAISLNGNGFNNWRPGSSLVSGLRFTAVENLEVLGVYNALLSDGSLNEQSFTDICLRAGNINIVCAQGFTAFRGVDSRVTTPLVTSEATIASGTSFNFTCRSQTGRDGLCSQYAFIRVTKDKIQSLQGDALSRADYYTVTSSDIDSYCSKDSFLYANDINFVSLDSAAKQVSRCQAILSGASF